LAVSAVPLVESPAALVAFRSLFCQLYGIDAPELPLDHILHWVDVARSLGLAENDVGRARARVFGGYFYNVSTLVPADAVIHDELQAGLAAGVEQYLVPTVRPALDTTTLETAGFVAVPWFVECVFEIEDGVDADLRRRVGRSRHQGILRIGRRARDRYPVTRYEAAELRRTPAVLETAARLHACNVDKYAHALNFYRGDLLRTMLSGPLGDHLVVSLRHDEHDGRPVQVSISLADRDAGQFHWLVQGIDHEHVEPGHNLFVAEAHDLLLWAETRGATVVDFSRGGVQQKARLGANRFFVLDNWVKSSVAGAASTLGDLAQRSWASIRATTSVLPPGSLEPALP
jgi:CelD/BcsL family acetyltransferase involved in cellulose biosynthesis